jgi:hypothetical protein
MSNHTAEPWHIGPDILDWLENGGFKSNPPAILDDNGDTVLSSSEWINISAADLRRIVLCVNKCAGLSDDQLLENIK